MRRRGLGGILPIHFIRRYLTRIPLACLVCSHFYLWIGPASLHVAVVLCVYFGYPPRNCYHYFFLSSARHGCRGYPRFSSWWAVLFCIFIAHVRSRELVKFDDSSSRAWCLFGRLTVMPVYQHHRPSYSPPMPNLRCFFALSDESRHGTRNSPASPPAAGVRARTVRLLRPDVRRSHAEKALVHRPSASPTGELMNDPVHSYSFLCPYPFSQRRAWP